MSTKIQTLYTAVDGFTQRRSFYSLKVAQRYAQERMGQFPDLAGTVAVSFDGVATLHVSGATLEDLFPATREVVEAPKAGIVVDEDGSDNYCGEDDLTEYYIELRNHEYAEIQTAIDAANGM